MTTTIEAIAALAGSYQGSGINHEGEPFTGRLTLCAVVGGRGVTVDYRATGEDGTVFHEEHSVIATSGAGALTLWTLDSHSGVVTPMSLVRAGVDDESRRFAVFGHGDPADRSSYRVQITLVAWANGDIGYDYAWGLPDDAFEERSAVRMQRSG